MRASSLFVAASVALGACASSAARPGASLSANSKVGDDLRAAANTWARAATERDGATMAPYFADDVIAMYPRHSQPTFGGKVNRTGWIETFNTPGLTHPITVDSIAVSASGDLGYTYGRWHLKAPAAGAAAMDIGGRYLAVWRPTGDSHAWQIVMLSANEHKPAPSM